MMRVIVTLVDDRIVRYVLFLELAVGHHLELLGVDALEKDGCGLVCWVLRHELASDGEVENLRARLGQQPIKLRLLALDGIDMGEQAVEGRDDALLLGEGRDGYEKMLEFLHIYV